MRDETVLVTPKLAEKWLEQNTNNRPMLLKRVQAYARDMSAGNWKLSHQGIAFLADKSLLDGQHRLAAVVLSGVSVQMKVTYGAPEQSALVIDVHGKRDPKDTLTIATHTPHSRLNIVIARTINSLKNNNNALTISELKEVVDFYREGIDWVEQNFGSDKALKFGPIAAGLAFAYPTDKKHVQQFAEAVRDGTNLTKGSPALVLRNTLILNRKREDKFGGTDIRKNIVLRVLRACQAYLNGERLTVLKPSPAAYDMFNQYWEKKAKRDAIAPLIQPIKRVKSHS